MRAVACREKVGQNQTQDTLCTRRNAACLLDGQDIIPGGYFANMYNTREQVNRDLHEGLQMVSEMVGDGYRPQSVVAGFLAAENQRFLAEEEGIHVCHGKSNGQRQICRRIVDRALPTRHFRFGARRKNELRIEVVNTWVNRIIGDMQLPEEELESWMLVNPYDAESPLQPSGLLGPVTVSVVAK